MAEHVECNWVNQGSPVCALRAARADALRGAVRNAWEKDCKLRSMPDVATDLFAPVATSEEKEFWRDLAERCGIAVRRLDRLFWTRGRCNE